MTITIPIIVFQVLGTIVGLGTLAFAIYLYAMFKAPFFNQ